MNEQERAEQEFQAYAQKFYKIVKKAIEPDMMKAVESNRHGRAATAAIAAMLELAGELESWLNEARGFERAPMEAIYATYTDGYNEGFRKIISMKNHCEACPDRATCGVVKSSSCALGSSEGAGHAEH